MVTIGPHHVHTTVHVQRCIQSASLRPGMHSFSFWTHRIWNKGCNWTQKKKSNVYANYERQEKHANGVFHKEIEHSHFSQQRNDWVP